MRRRAAIPVSIALTLVAACVYNNTPEWMVGPRYAGCTQDEVRAISHAFVVAAKLSDAALKAINDPANRRRAEAEEWNAYRWWFGEFAPRRFGAVQTVLAATRAELEQIVSIRCGEKTVNCPQPRPFEATSNNRWEDPEEYGPEFEGNRPPGREWQEFAYANHMIPVVQLCSDFFLQTRADQAAILLHELTHVSSDTVDYAYGEPALLLMAQRNPEDAVRNAANYAAFAESVKFGRKPGVRNVPTDERD